MPDHVEDMKAGRVVVSQPQEGGSFIWYYEDGLLKNQVRVEGRGQGPQSLRHSKPRFQGKCQPARQTQDLPLGQRDREIHTDARTLGR